MRSTVAGLFIALFGRAAIAVIARDVRSTSGHVFLHAIYCSLAILVLWIVRQREHLPLSSIGLRRPTWMTVVTAVVLYGVAFYALPYLNATLLKSIDVRQSMHQLAMMPLWLRVIVGATGGIVEEILYRGYAIERLAALTGKLWLGATIATAAFALAHVPAWGLTLALAGDLPFGIVMTLAYVWRRDLVANILVHSTALVVAMFMLKRAGRQRRRASPLNDRVSVGNAITEALVADIALIGEAITKRNKCLYTIKSPAVVTDDLAYLRKECYTSIPPNDDPLCPRAFPCAAPTVARAGHHGIRRPQLRE